ncbi:hypothetical protein ACHAXT_010123 [Thalassiosira profunda]
MATRRGYYPTAGRPAVAMARSTSSVSGSSVGYQAPGHLRNYRQEDVVQALMLQLREKEADLTLMAEQQKVHLQRQQILEQTNLQLRSKAEQHHRAVMERGTRVAMLEQKLAQERKGTGSHIAEANLAHLTEKNAEMRRLLSERDDELSQLRPVLKDLKAKVEVFENDKTAQQLEVLEEEVAELRLELAEANHETEELEDKVEEMENTVKKKEWMIKSLQQESEDQRGRENMLAAQVKTLSQKVETYETKFKGGGIDVPMLLAKLKDYEVCTKDMQGQIRRLTNKKLNELVVRSATPVPQEAKENAARNTPPMKETEMDDMSQITDQDSFLVHSASDDGGTLGDGTFISNISDEAYTKVGQDEDMLSDFITDVKAGIETLEMGGMCCMQRPSPVLSPLSENGYASPRRR